MEYLYVENNIDEGMDNCFNCASECVEEYLAEDSDIECIDTLFPGLDPHPLSEPKLTVIYCIECGAMWNNITRRVINERHQIYTKCYRELLKLKGSE